MLQVFCLDVAKVDLDVAYTCMLQAYVSKCFHVFYTYVCKCFIWMLHMFAIVFKYFSGVLASVSNAYFKCFICLLLYVATAASGCFKSRSGVTHEMRVESGRRRRLRPRRRGRCQGQHWQCPRQCGPTVGALPREPDALGTCSLSMRVFLR